MIIGVDFDNTIVNYDNLFYDLALEKKLIPPEIGSTKNQVRDYLHKSGKEDEWTELQGLVYGSHITDANPFPGIKEFLRFCFDRKIKVYIVSHKTHFPVIGAIQDLHKCAMKWLGFYGFFNQPIYFSRKKVFLELTKKDKLNRIRKLGCDFFIDDLPEFLAEENFSPNVKKILFDPDNMHEDISEFKRMNSWIEIQKFIELKRQ